MKFFIALLFCCAFAFQAAAQLYISTSSREVMQYDETTEEWETVGSDEETTLFEFNKEMTMFKHTTKSISSSYFIKKTEEEETMVTMEIVSDVGNKYVMVLHFEKELVSFFYKKKDVMYAIKYSIKKAWTEED